MADPLSELTTELELLAKPTVKPVTTGGGTATAEGILSTAAGLLIALESIPDGIGEAIATVAKDIGKALAGAAEALDTIAKELGSLPPGTEVAKALSGLQNGLSTAQTLMPGGGAATALQSGSAFFQMLEKLLNEASEPPANVLYLIAQELRAIGVALEAPPQA